MHAGWYELTLAPLLVWQGRRVRRDTPRLPEAEGARAGRTPGDGAPLRLLVAGDSAAAGVGARHQDEAIAGCLVRELARRSGRSIDWRLEAATGLTAAALAERLSARLGDRSAHAGPYDVVLMVVGVNDVTERTASGRWRSALTRLCAQLRAHSPEAFVLWSGLPPMHRFPALPQPLRAYLGARARHLDRELGAWVARQPDMARLGLPDLDEPALMASDGFHPGPAGHRLWADLVARAFLERAGHRAQGR